MFSEIWPPPPRIPADTHGHPTNMSRGYPADTHTSSMPHRQTLHFHLRTTVVTANIKTTAAATSTIIATTAATSTITAPGSRCEPRSGALGCVIGQANAWVRRQEGRYKSPSTTHHYDHREDHPPPAQAPTHTSPPPIARSLPPHTTHRLTAHHHLNHPI